MTSLLLFCVGLASAAPPERPEPPPAVAGERLRVYPVNRGTALPSDLLSRPGVAACSAVAVPLSQYADLLKLEAWGKAVSDIYRIDTAELIMERDWYKVRLEEEIKPKPWLERPSTQRWFGRLETLVTVGVVAVGLSAAYQYGSGGFK